MEFRRFVHIKIRKRERRRYELDSEKTTNPSAPQNMLRSP